MAFTITCHKKDQVAWSVGLSVIVVSPAKISELIEIPFGMWTGEPKKSGIG